MTRIWKSWCFYFFFVNLHFYQIRSIRSQKVTINAQCYGYYWRYPISYSCCCHSYQGVNHPARQNYIQMWWNGLSIKVTRISSRRMRAGKKPAWSIPLSDICSGCPRSWWMLDHTGPAPTLLVGSSTWNIKPSFYRD